MNIGLCTSLVLAASGLYVLAGRRCWRSLTAFGKAAFLSAWLGSTSQTLSATLKGSLSRITFLLGGYALLIGIVGVFHSLRSGREGSP